MSEEYIAVLVAVQGAYWMVDPNATEEQTPQRLKPKSKTADRVSYYLYYLFSTFVIKHAMRWLLDSQNCRKPTLPVYSKFMNQHLALPDTRVRETACKKQCCFHQKLVVDEDGIRQPTGRGHCFVCCSVLWHWRFGDRKDIQSWKKLCHLSSKVLFRNK